MVDAKKEVPKLNSLPKSFQDWEVGNNYEVVKQVGSGSYGYVVQAIQKSTGKKVAIKRLNKIFEGCHRLQAYPQRSRPPQTSPASQPGPHYRNS